MVEQTMAIERRSVAVGFVIFLLVLAALWLRLASIGVDGLWLDEIFGASYVNLSFLEIVIAVFRFDIHPPFYYLQLKLWSIPSQSDGWLLANSAIWSVSTVAVATYGSSRIVGYKKALLTTAVLTVLGSEIYYASELRMYAMISCVTVVAWVFARAFVEKETKKNTLLLFASLSLLAGIHSAAFIPISAVLLYAFLELSLSHGVTNSVKKLVPIAILVGVVLAPCLLNASIRSVSHTGTPSLKSLVMMLSGWVLGYGELQVSYDIRVVITLSIVVLTLIGVWFGDKTIRLLLICFVIWPLLMMGGVSAFVRPIWIPRSAAFCAPFFAMSAALLLSNVRFYSNGWASVAKGITFSVVFIVILALGGG